MTTLPALLEKLEKAEKGSRGLAEIKFWLTRISRDHRVPGGANNLAEGMLHTLATKVPRPTDRQLAAMVRLISDYRSGALRERAEQSREAKSHRPAWLNQLSALRAAKTRRAR